MFSNNLMSFIILNIYVLVIINGLLVSVIFISVFKDKLQKYRYEQRYKHLKPYVIRYLEQGDNLRRMKTKTLKKQNFRIVLDMMIEYSKENNIDIVEKFEDLGCLEYLTERAKHGIDFNIINKLGVIKSPKAYNTLLSWTNSEDFEEKYMSFYALSLLKLEEEKMEKVIDKLINSDVSRDRQIEIINNFNLTINKYLELLEKQQTELGKVVLLRVIQSKEEIMEEVFSERIVNYLSLGKEVRISSVLTLASSKNLKYLPLLINMYRTEKAWEVRAAITKSLVNFPSDYIIDIIKEMIYDEEWWVRFNAVEILAKLGTEGLITLIDLSQDLTNEKVSSLANYVLNANKSVFEKL